MLRGGGRELSSRLEGEVDEYQCSTQLGVEKIAVRTIF